jgi:nucleoside-diphosphate-sugar epimerase
MTRGLTAKRILVTGASGFIGARITECLTRAYGVTVHALAHRLGTVGAARIARLANVRMCYGDIRDAQAVREAAAGCEAVVHCATGTFGSARDQEAATVDGTRHVLEAAQRGGAQRVVYFSSASVHGPARSGTIAETDPFAAGFPYARMKIEAEQIVAAYGTRYGLAAVILRPTCVWGPFSPNWTVGAVELIRQGAAFLPLGGRGTANAVYVDHVVDAVALALRVPQAAGEAFLINDDAPATWGELYGGYARHLGAALRFAEDADGAAELWRVSLHNAGLVLRRALRGDTRFGIRTLREFYTHVPLAQYGVWLLPEPVKRSLKRYAADRELALEAVAAPSRAGAGFLSCNVLPKPTRLLYGSTGRYANEKAKRLLGWTPRLPFEQAMALTCEWLSYAGYAR